MNKTLYVYRPLLNADEFIEWAKSVGFKTTLKPEEMHVTIAFSREPVEWNKFKPEEFIFNIRGGKRSLEQFDGGATVMQFESERLKDRWDEFKAGGASWDFPDYKSHITISYKAENMNVSKLEPYRGMLRFGPEVFKEVDLDWKSGEDKEQ